jgi:hypothetical protein
MDPDLVAGEHVQDGKLFTLRRFAVIVAVEGVVSRGQQPQTVPAALACIRAQLSGIRFGDNDEIDSVREVIGWTVEPVHDRGARRTWLFDKR